MKKFFIIISLLMITTICCNAQSFHAKKYRSHKQYKMVSFCITGQKTNPSDPSKRVDRRIRKFLLWRIK